MTDRIVENADQIVDEMKRKARRRLVGAIVLALAAAIMLPMLLEKEPRPLGDDVSVKIPPVDEGKFVNRLTGKSGDARALPKADERVESKAATSKAEPRSEPAATAGAAPATVAAPEATAAKKSVAEAEQRALAPSAKTSTRSEANATPVADAKSSDSNAAPAEAKSAAVETRPLPAEAKPADEKAATTVATAQPAPAPVAASPAKADGFVVQLAAFADDKGANSLANKLKRAGYAAFVEPVHTSRGTLWRVRVGGYGSKPEAETARVKLKGEGYSGIVAPAS